MVCEKLTADCRRRLNHGKQQTNHHEDCETSSDDHKASPNAAIPKQFTCRYKFPLYQQFSQAQSEATAREELNDFREFLAEPPVVEDAAFRAEGAELFSRCVSEVLK